MDRDLPELPGVMVYGTSKLDAVNRVQVLALSVLAEKVAAELQNTPIQKAAPDSHERQMA